MRYILILGLFLLQEPEEDPHANQPASCNNHAKTESEHRCACRRATECPDGEEHPEDSKCKTYCRPSACRCLNPCTTHRHAPNHERSAATVVPAPQHSSPAFFQRMVF